MKRAILLLIILCCGIETKADTNTRRRAPAGTHVKAHVKTPEKAHVMSYEACVNKTLAMVYNYESRTRKRVSRVNKRLAIERDCDHIRRASRPEPENPPVDMIKTSRRRRR